MALDETNRRLFVVFRRPAEMQVLDTATGSLVSRLPTVGDADDVFYDSARRLIYVTGGDGAVAVIEQYREIARLPTRKGARTSLYVPEWGKLFVAARAEGSDAASIFVYRVTAAASSTTR